MKLIFCPECLDLRLMHYEKMYCKCGLSWGQYTDKANVTIGGRAVPTGIDNKSFFLAYGQQMMVFNGIFYKPRGIGESIHIHKEEGMNKHELYLYDVTLGVIEDGEKHSNHRVITVAAIDAEHVTIELREKGLLDYDEENDLEEFIESVRKVGKLDHIFDGS